MTGLLGEVPRRVRHWVRLAGLRGCILCARELCGDRAAVRVPLRGFGGPVTLRLGTTDLEVAWTVLGRRDYDCVPNIQNVGTVMDAGAYTGLSALYFAHRFPSATIVAIEPCPSNFAVLAQNVSGYERIKPVCAALWSECGSAAICDRNTGHWGFALQAVSRMPPMGEVECLTIPRIMDVFGLRAIDILKLDIEGAEREVLGSSAGWIDKVRVLVAELHDRITPGCSMAWDDATRGFSWHRHGSGLVVAGRDQV